ncbi:hypothetical protein [Floccifex sp.]|uniref:hypothetical protein n=1 Tax=Floccifex sp. TaxID=2815810 RepID=UPI003F04D5D5
MRVRLYVVVDIEDESIVNEVKKEIQSICDSFSFSPCREQPSLRNCMEFYGSADIHQENIENILSQLNNDWEGEIDDCCAYGFNTKMFHPHVYYLQFQIL